MGEEFEEAETSVLPLNKEKKDYYQLIGDPQASATWQHTDRIKIDFYTEVIEDNGYAAYEINELGEILGTKSDQDPVVQRNYHFSITLGQQEAFNTATRILNQVFPEKNEDEIRKKIIEELGE